MIIEIAKFGSCTSGMTYRCHPFEIASFADIFCPENVSKVIVKNLSAWDVVAIDPFSGHISPDSAIIFPVCESDVGECL